ncbi:MAG: phosphate/phosphite/phosphonate ABC transporter substrate-binding protein [Acidimicrobiales bacterium]
MPAPRPTPLSRRLFLRNAGLLAAGAGGLALAGCGRSDAPTVGAGTATGSGSLKVPSKLSFGVGPLLPTTTDTKAAYGPFFAWLASQLGTKHELVAVDSWGGISVALGSDQLDVAWMGPFGYVLANARSGAEAVAPAKSDGQPVYHAIIVGRPDLEVRTWPDDAKGRSISFTEVSSTSGWLVPTHWFKSRGMDPKTYFFRYTEGASHAANELAVASGQADFATDFDRNRRAMIETGRLKADANRVVWTSDPLPNDAIGVRKGLDPALADRIRELLTAMTPEFAATVLPTHYDGFVAATNETYKPILDAALSVDALKR